MTSRHPHRTLSHVQAACVRLHANVRGYADLRPYVYLLTLIRDSEPHNGLADGLTARELRHLVLDIWHGRSVLSERSEPEELRLPRYDLSEPWSPWNCLLLAEDEAEAHLRAGGGGVMYSEHLRRRIGTAHRTARMEFR